MFKCIICLNIYEDEKRSLEHIFPESIGGCITIDKVCKNCNDHLGSYVDSYLVNHWFIQMKRLQYKLGNKNGKLPNPFGEGVLNNDQTQKIKYLISDDGKPLGAYLVNNKTTSNHNGNTIIKFIMDKSSVSELSDILNTTKERLKKQYGPEVKFEDIKFFEGKIDKPIINFKKKLHNFNWQRCILKIAYELTYRLIGEEYLDDPIAFKIRELLKKKAITRKDLFDAKINGTLSYAEHSKSLPFIDDPEYLHAAHLFIDNKLSCVVRIFDLFHCMVVMSHNRKGNPDTDNKIYQINVKSKNFIEWEYLKYMSTFHIIRM